MRRDRITLAIATTAVVACVVTTGWSTNESELQKERAKPDLPPPVAKALADNRPNAKIAKLEVEKESGVNLYDIEFQANEGEIEVAEDGTVIDIAVIVQPKDVPKPALAAIRKGAGNAKITQLEKSEVRAEVKDGKVVQLATPRYVYEAELSRGNQITEIQVTPEGQVIEGPRWKGKPSKKE